MTPDEFRTLALALPDVEESAHMGHPDFRVRGKVFATLGYPDETWGMVALTPVDQQLVVTAAPEMFVPVKGAWGRRGATSVRLQEATKKRLRDAMQAAWKNALARRAR